MNILKYFSIFLCFNITFYNLVNSMILLKKNLYFRSPLTYSMCIYVFIFVCLVILHIIALGYCMHSLALMCFHDSCPIIYNYFHVAMLQLWLYFFLALVISINSSNNIASAEGIVFFFIISNVTCYLFHFIDYHLNNLDMGCRGAKQFGVYRDPS